MVMSLNIERLDEYPVVSIDIESTGLHWHTDKLFGVAIAAYDGERIYSDYFDIRTNDKILPLLRDKVPQIKLLVNHNAKFDAHFLLNERVLIPTDRIECTMVRAALINEWETSFSLDVLAGKYLNARKVDIYPELARLFGGAPTRAVQIKNLHRAPEALARKYAIEDPVLAIKLWLWQEDEIKRQGLEQVWQLEKDVLPVLLRMERQGVRVDEDRAHESLGVLDVKITEATNRLHKVAGHEVNVNSSKQMRSMFGVEKRDDGDWYCGAFKCETTGGGEASIDADALRILDGLGNDKAKAVLNLRKMIKTKSFLKDHVIGHSIDGFVYPNYNQARSENGLGTGTGRFSINDPALQQIPARDVEVAEIVRSCFIPEYGNEWCCFDFKQFEQRWFGHYANDENVYQMYRDDPNVDFYQIMANLTGLPRNPGHAGQANAKQMTLAAIFGMGAGKLAKEMGMPYIAQKRDGHTYYKAGREAYAVLDKFHGAVPGIRHHLERAESIAKSRGYVKTVMGRHLRFPNGMGAHKAGGLVLQGSAADSLKLKMVRIAKLIGGTDIKMLLSVHDEIDMDVPPHEKHLIPGIIKEYTAFDGVEGPLCRTPIICNADFGANWYEASK
jgi:DNA polymerase-1